MERKFLFLITFILFTAKTFSQENVMTDILGDKYYIYNNEIQKNIDGKLYKYKNILNGKLNNIDIVNPLQILLFYKEQNTIVILDKNLTEVKTINLSTINHTIQPIFASLAIKNQIWIYDIISKKIGLLNNLDLDFMPITNTINGDLIWFSSTLNNFYFLTKTQNLVEVDIYGKLNHITTIPEKTQIKYHAKIFEIIENETSKTIKKFQINKGEIILLTK